MVENNSFVEFLVHDFLVLFLILLSLFYYYHHHYCYFFILADYYYINNITQPIKIMTSITENTLTRAILAKKGRKQDGEY